MICLNPTSTLHPVRALNPVSAFGLLFNRASGKRLGSEAKKLRHEGADVVLIQPTARDLETMGVNLMSGKNRNATIEVARETVAAQRVEPATAESSRRPGTRT